MALAVDLGRRPRSWVVTWGVYQERHSRANAGPGRGVPVGRGHQRHRLSRGAYRYQGADAHRSRLALSGRSTSGTGIKQLLRDDLSHQCHRSMGGATLGKLFNFRRVSRNHQGLLIKTRWKLGLF